jgi:hypothetical protein
MLFLTSSTWKILQFVYGKQAHIFYLWATPKFGPEKNEVIEEWRKLHNVELCDKYCSPNITGLFKSRRMRWTGHVARMGERIGAYMVWWGNRMERD